MNRQKYQEEKKEIQSDFILGTNVENFSEEKLEKME